MAKPIVNFEIKIDGVKEAEVCLLMADWFMKKEQFKKLTEYRNLFMTENKCANRQDSGETCLRDIFGEPVSVKDPTTLCDCCKELHTIYTERKKIQYKLRDILCRVKARLSKIITPISTE